MPLTNSRESSAGSSSDPPKRTIYPTFASTKRSSTKKVPSSNAMASSSTLKAKTPVPRSQPQSTPKGTQFTVEISDSESESAVKARPDEEGESPDTDDESIPPASSILSQRKVVAVANHEDEDEEANEESGNSSRPSRSKNTARCSRGKKPAKMQPASSNHITHKVSSFKPLNTKASQMSNGVNNDSAKKPPRPKPRPTMEKASSPKEAAAAAAAAPSKIMSAFNQAKAVFLKGSSVEDSDSEEFHEPSEYRRSVSMENEVTQTDEPGSSKKRKVDDTNVEFVGEGMESDAVMALPPTNSSLEDPETSTDAGPEPSPSKRRRKLSDESDGEDDTTRVAVELESSVDSHIQSKVTSSLDNGADVTDESVSPTRQGADDESSNSQNDDTLMDSRATFSNPSSDFVSREEMKKAIEQVRQEMRDEMNKMREALRIDTKRMVRAEVKDEILLARE